MPFYDYAHDPEVTACPCRMLDVLRPYANRDDLLLCPDCVLPLRRIWTVSHDKRAAEDSIPGGLVLENYGPEHITVYSHSERKRLLKVGPDGKPRVDKITGTPYELQEMVRHTPVPGTGRSPHTTDWSAGSIDPVTLENARVLVSRSSGASDADSDEVPNDPSSVRDLPYLRLFNEAHSLKGR